MRIAWRSCGMETREITKKFETIVVLKAGDVKSYLTENAAILRGEFVLIIDAHTPEILEKQAENAQLSGILKVLLKTLSVKQAAGIAAELAGCGKNEAYQMALNLKQEANNNDH